MKIYKVFGILVVCLGIFIFMMGIYNLVTSSESPKIKKVDCYDRYGNKIIEVDCEEKVYKNFPLEFIFVGVLLIVGGVVLYHIDTSYLN